jgi:glycosyltransferase involved in cell wall biosynthesis
MARILVVCNSTFFLANMRLPVVRALVARGHEVECVCGGDGHEKMESSVGLRVHNCPFPRHASVAAFWRSAAALCRIIRAGQYDCVISSNRNSSIVARLAAWRERVPVNIYTAHGFYFHDDHGVLGREVLMRFEALLASITSCIFSVTAEDMNLMVSRGFVTPDRIVWIGQGIDTSRFCPTQAQAAAEEKSGLAPVKLRVVAVGRVVEGKGFSDLLRALARLRNEGYQMELVLVGGNIASEISPLSRELLEETRALKIADAVTVTGMVHNVEDYLAASDVFVIPSYREGLSRALLEAMSMGLAVIATSIRGNREVIQDGASGLLYPARDVDELASRLRLLYDDSALRRRLGQNARGIVLERFDESDFVSRQIVEIERLLAERGIVRAYEPSQSPTFNQTVGLSHGAPEVQSL